MKHKEPLDLNLKSISALYTAREKSQKTENLSNLDVNRRELNHILNERNQVLDLLNETVKPGVRVQKGVSRKRYFSCKKEVI